MQRQYGISAICSNVIIVVVVLDLAQLETIHQLANLVDPDSDEG